MLERFKKEKLAIKFDSVKEQIEFLEIAEKEGFKWNSGKKPTEYIPAEHYDNEDEACIISCCHNALLWGEQLCYDITWKDYKAENEEITFSYSYLKGDVHWPSIDEMHTLRDLDFEKILESTTSKAQNNIIIIPKCTIIKAIYPNEKKRIVVVKWGDDTTTKVKCSENDNFDIYVGVALAIAIKKYGTNSQFRKNVDKLVKEEK